MPIAIQNIAILSPKSFSIFLFFPLAAEIDAAPRIGAELAKGSTSLDATLAGRDVDD